jgi:hypothetical protein
MDGVVILDTISKVTETVSQFSIENAIASGVFGLFVGLSICLGISLKTKYEPSRPFVGMFSMFVAIGIGYLGGWMMAEKTPTKVEEQYVVELTEELNYKEFIEKYEVIDFEDGAYTIRERG